MEVEGVAGGGSKWRWWVEVGGWRVEVEAEMVGGVEEIVINRIRGGELTHTRWRLEAEGGDGGGGWRVVVVGGGWWWMVEVEGGGWRLRV